MSHLRIIGQRLAAKANADGRFPPEFKTILKDGEFSRELECPASELSTPYAYVAGQRLTSDPRNVLVYEKQANHLDGASNVLFVDGRVETIAPYEKVLKLVAETEGRLRAAATRPVR